VLFTAGKDLAAGVKTGWSCFGAGQLMAALAARTITKLTQRTRRTGAVVTNLLTVVKT
jgi:hypothetical protein